RYGGLIRGTLAKAREARLAKKSASAVLDKAAPARRRLISFQDGMSFLTDTLAERIGENLLLGISNLKFEFSNSSGEFVVAFDRAGNREQVATGRVILATPSLAASRLVAPFSDELKDLLEEIEYPPLAILYLSYDRQAVKNPLIGFGFLAAPSEGLNILGCVWNTSLFKNRAPEGKALMTVFIGGARNPAVGRRGDAELASIAHNELQPILGIRAEPRVIAVTRWERAIPQYNLGHKRRVERIEAILKQIPGLSIVGNYLHGVSTGDVIKEADRVAREIAG
ncbi:MAG TPA: protoporphyrinogen oxidase, partial [Blastocatellia bacterium]|nr:protoporphyrinogen oxidase [Blastocatellia bacterium]